jgi:hypothetical protein
MNSWSKAKTAMGILSNLKEKMVHHIKEMILAQKKKKPLFIESLG